MSQAAKVMKDSARTELRNKEVLGILMCFVFPVLVNAAIGLLLSAWARLPSVNYLVKAVEVDRRITRAEMIAMLPTFDAARVGASASSLYRSAGGMVPVYDVEFGNGDTSTGLEDVEIGEKTPEDLEAAARQEGEEIANKVVASTARGIASSSSAISFQRLLDETSKDCLPLDSPAVSVALGVNVVGGTKPLNIAAARINRNNGGRIGPVVISKVSPPSTPTPIRRSGSIRMLTDRLYQPRFSPLTPSSSSSHCSGIRGIRGLCDSPFDNAYYPYAWETRSSGGVLRLKSEGVLKHMRTVFLNSPQRPSTREYEHPATVALREEVAAHVAAAQARQDLIVALGKVYPRSAKK
ncbi:hypothetical protein BOTBODRAFT_256167 [Botryobasidium botryosum FD-172 SS1]|uniref:Uncharacterized protein n=1 Tax=Botryobasidium botryosum (strain FD-172 SS1) TaxID=930990 RepID=A0A067M346_BOTB1|nr:hypothetical protein BOTBODRAFT_256167 [Botryobasidium botryosum FD-172 SS1]